MSEEIRVLHVDDQPDVADLTAEALEREDDRLSVETATSVAEGLDRLTDTVDCVVSDYDMPERNGIDFLQAVRERYPDLPFVLFTGKGSEEVASEAISAGVTEYLEKESGLGQYTALANRIANAVEQHRSKRALEASERRLSLFVEQSPLGVVEWDENFEVVRLNDAAEEILGYDEAELRGASWERIVPESDAEQVGDVVDTLLRGQGGYRSVNENVRADGDMIVCEWHNRVVTDGDEVVAVFSQFQDITDRVERERQLERSTARLGALFENSPDMINVHDTEGNIIDPNPRLCERTGYDAAELADMKVWDVDDRIEPAEARALWETMAVGDRHRVESVYRHRDGSTFPVEIHLQRLDLAGEDRFVVISRDISERKARERELEQYETIVETIDDIAMVVGPDRTIEYVNETGLQYAGAPAGEIVGVPILDLADKFFTEAGSTERFERALDRAFDATPPVDAAERLEFEVDADVGEVVLEYQFFPVFDGDDPTAIVITIRDITERTEREQELERQNERLEEFVSVVSHDLQNPLNVAAGRLEIADEECESEHLDAAERALERMDEQIADLLRLTREGERVNEIESVALADVVEECWHNVATGEAELVVETTRTVRADPGRLQHLLENLLQNSIEYGWTGDRARPDDTVERGSSDGAGVTVTVGDVDGGFYVADNGPGIPESKRSQVFESGYSTAPDGTGFGLAIVKEVVEAHGWSIRVAESTDGGARFEITGVEDGDA